MKTGVFISVVVPCYNQAQYLSETLQSVLNQSYSGWECVIVDDGSPDNTEDIAQEWIIKDSRFRYLKKTNVGLSDARNAGIEFSKGEWILPLDADDKIGKDYLKLASQIIKNQPQVGLIYANSSFFDNVEGEWVLPEYNFERLLFSNHIYCSAFFSKADWNLTGGYDTNLKYGREDWEFWINLLSKTHKEVVKLNYLGFFYRQKGSSMDSSLNENKNKIRDIENYIYEKHKGLYIKYFGSPQQVLYEKMLLEEKNWRLEQYQNKIYKNWITRILYKIITLFV